MNRMSASYSDDFAKPPRPLGFRDAAETIAISLGRDGHSDDSGGSSSESAQQLRVQARQHVALVEGSRPRLTAETAELLRSRLRLAAIVVFACFLAFLIRWFVLWDEWGKAEHRFLFYSHMAVTALLGAATFLLCRRCTFSLLKLRFAEFVVFGAPAFYIFVLGLHEITFLTTLPEGAQLPTVVVPWLLMMFSYALFIPNTW